MISEVLLKPWLGYSKNIVHLNPCNNNLIDQSVFCNFLPGLSYNINNRKTENVKNCYINLLQINCLCRIKVQKAKPYLPNSLTTEIKIIKFHSNETAFW